MPRSYPAQGRPKGMPVRDIDFQGDCAFLWDPEGSQLEKNIISPAHYSKVIVMYIHGIINSPKADES